MWDFSTDPDVAVDLAWVEAFMADEVEPLDLLFPDQAFGPQHPALRDHVNGLKQQVRDRRMWAAHLPPELGGQGYGAVRLALLNEILGRSQGEHNLGWGSVVFGTQAPDTGNAEILARYGSAEQRAKYLQPLLDGEILSCFSMTEPQGGSDPGMFTTRAVRDGDQWVITGEKWFTSNARYASLLIVMAITDPDVDVHRGASMFLVPAGTDGVGVLRDVATSAHTGAEGTHGYVRYSDVRVPADSLLGQPGSGFAVAQTRLAGGRLHHAMRTVAQCRRALDMMCERAVSRRTKGEPLGSKQLVQQSLAESYLELEQFRLFVLRTAWIVDTEGSQAARRDIAGCKVLAAKVMTDVIGRAIHLHGSLGMSNELPLALMWLQAPWMGVMDGPTEVHLGTVSRSLLRDQAPSSGPWPTEHRLEKEAAARRSHAELLARVGA